MAITIRTEPMYITKQNYLDFSGIDLVLELQGANYDNPSDMVDTFIVRLEEWALSYLFMKFGTSTTYPTDDDDVAIFDADAFSLGLLHQIDYLRRNGDLSIQSINKGKVLAPNTYMIWKNAGMCNLAHKRTERLGYWV